MLNFLIKQHQNLDNLLIISDGEKKNGLNFAWWAAKIITSEIVGLQPSYAENNCYKRPVRILECPLSYFPTILFFQGSQLQKKLLVQISVSQQVIRDLVSISPTFYKQLFCTKDFRTAFLYLHCRFKLFQRKEIGAKAACKMLAKLTPAGVNFTNILRAAFTRSDPKKAKKTVKLSSLIALLGSLRTKAACKMLAKLTPALLALRIQGVSHCSTLPHRIRLQLNFWNFHRFKG